MDALGLDEHSEAGRFLTAFDTLCEEADIADSLIVHHMGHQGERSRGDSRLRDWPDVEWRLVRQNEDPASPRYMSAYGRDVDQPEAQIFHDTESRHLTLVGGSRATAKAREAIPDILAFVTGQESVSKAAVIKGVDHPEHAVREGIRLALRDGQLVSQPGNRGAHLLSIPGQRGSSADHGSSSADFSPSSTAARQPLYRADEVPRSPKHVPKGDCFECDHPIPGAHRPWCPTVLPDPMETE